MLSIVRSAFYFAKRMTPENDLILGNRLVVETIQVPIPQLHPALDGFKIVQLSDLHYLPYTSIRLIRQAIAWTNRLQPDLVVLTGDFVTKDPETIFGLAPALSELNAKYGVYTVLGNHDVLTNARIVQNGLSFAGLPILRNKGVPITVGHGMIYLAGVDDCIGGRPNLKAALNGTPTDVPVVLLAHEPDVIDHFSLDRRVALQLSGHTHGGQVRLPFFGAPILPRLGEKYDQGLYRVNDAWLYTNRGIGAVSAPIRFNAPSEITEIILCREECEDGRPTMDDRRPTMDDRR